MLIIAGGYEGGIIGVDVPLSQEGSPSTGPNDDYIRFRFICSQGSIRCLALGADVLSCGGTDETVQVYTLNNRKKHGDLLLSEGCITALGLSGGLSKGQLLVGNENGGLAVYGLRHLELLKQLKGEKTAITSLSVHPNGELALSVSEAGGLRLWDLKTFLCVFYNKLNEPAIKVEWHPSGEDYYILSENQLLKLSLNEETKPCLYKAQNANKHTCAAWVGTSIAVGCRSGDVIVYPAGIEHGFAISQVHHRRIKAIASKEKLVVTGDSDGVLICSSVMSDEQGSPSLVKHWEYDVGMRVNTLVCRHND
ncbi:hypothetical protein BgAZ_107140 [Babesia gibsoni]|uniref:Ig-like domain-containing protein n=1 Tax=Babesia gibsoni TaxID=33632 RepID=A0AAD8UVY5_BABGI|nr:hypothetical protein BgAZ_107140 [Babesia gibsoni]